MINHKRAMKMAPWRRERVESLLSWQYRLIPAALILICTILPIIVHFSFPVEYLDVGTLYRQYHDRMDFARREGLVLNPFIPTANLMEYSDETDAQKQRLMFSSYDSYKESQYLLESENDVKLLSSLLQDHEQHFLRRRLSKEKNDDDIFDEDIDATVEKPSQKPYHREILLVGDSLLTVPELFFNISHMIRDEITRLHPEFEVLVSSIMKGGLTLEEISRSVHKKFDDRAKIGKPYPDVVSQFYF